MKIVDLYIQGFRSLKEVTWKPGDLNLIIGPNGSGKSNLLKALEMLSGSARGRLADQVTREGGMESLVWDGSAPQIDISVTSSPIDPPGTLERPNMYYHLVMARLGKSSAYRIENELFGVAPQDKERKETPPIIILRSPSQAVVYDEQQKALAAPSDTVPDEETLLSVAAGPFTANRLIPAFQQWLANWAIFHDFQTHSKAAVRIAPIARSEKAVSPDGENLIQVLHTLYTGNRDFKRDLNLAMHAAFGEDFEEIIFPPDADQRIQMKIRWKSLQRERSTADLSDGTLRFLYMITILANPNPSALIAIDEPENGLHPSMLPIIAEFARDASKRTQVILTTHSAELLDAFSEYSPTVTVANWENGQSVFNVVTKAQLDYWLEDYTLGKLFRSGSLEDMG